GESDDSTAEQALSGFNKFPEWMWRNTDVRDFVNWLRERNAGVANRAGFYGMDLYSLYRSRDAVLAYLDQVDPSEAERARERYATLNTRLGDGDPQTYGYAVAYGMIQSAAGPVAEQFEQVRRIAEAGRNSPDPAVADAAFIAEQNARLIVNAEEYYRMMYNPRVNTWNLRDKHMTDTLDALAEHLRRRDGFARIAVWAHNSHLGDARATDATYRGEWNVGQLVRERHPNQAVLIGFSTNTGTVMATSDWGVPGVVKQVRPGLAGSYERVFHESGIPAFVLRLQAEEFRQPMLQRAIGVIYRPETERQSHYFEARLADQFDAMIHFDNTTAVEPLAEADAVTEDRAA
ncbi:MAG TPA: erythromycin esterase family protein, partial [Bryobacteraceae bacterium]|nr:erythromycin esterase family protein [Bryobacteraceae bacterium]